MSWRSTAWMLAKIALALSLVFGVPAVSRAQTATTPVTETVYHADGTVASGSVIVSWPSFTAANGASIPAGTTTATIGTGGVLSVSLVANAGSTPIGSYYTAVYHLDDGTVTREYWVVPVSAAPVQVSAIKSTAMPLTVAQQTVSKAYVDTAIATAIAGHPLDASTPYVLKAGDTMTGPLVLPGDPTAPLQAAEKQYVDAGVAGLTAGLAQKVSTLPSGTQTVAQPTGSTLAVNRLNGVEYASQYASGAGNNGIANATSSADCANGCEVKAEATYASATETPAPATWNSGTHVSDSRGGAVQDTYFNPQSPIGQGLDAGQKIQVVSTRPTSAVLAETGSGEVFSVGLQLEQDGLAGGNNLYPTQIQGTVPYFKTSYSALLATGTNNTPGQHVLMPQNQNCYGVGDCLIGGQFITSSGGFRDAADEGAHPYDIDILEDSRVFEATCASGCTTGSTTLQLTVTANGGTQGEGRFLIDTNPAKTISTGTLIGATTTGAGARQPEAIFSGTAFPVSTFLETAQTIPTQATVIQPGTVTVAIATSGVPSGFQTSTAALPAASGVACVTDAAVSDNRPLNYEMAAYTTVDASHLQLTLNKAHASGATLAVGGLCGYGLEQTVDTSAGIRQVFPVVGSTSPTTLLYAGGVSSVIGAQGTTSAYLNVNAAVASIARSGNVVTVTTAGNLPVDVNGLTLTIAGVADPSYNGSFAVATTGPNTFTYAQTGANSSSSGGSASIVTGGYVLYPMAEVLGVYNAATKAVDGQMTLAANTVPWAAGDPVEQPHYFQERISADVANVEQIEPRSELNQAGGIAYQGNNGPGLRGWQISNQTAASNYLGNGGTHTAPDLAFEALGPWQRTMGLEAGERAAFAVHCNSHGCGRWNSTYNLFELDSSTGVDTIQYAPTGSTLNFNLAGTVYGFSPTALTAGTVQATTVNAATLNGAVAAAGLPVFGPSGAGHAKGAVPDPGATAGSSRYLREDGTWVVPAGGGGGASIPGTGFVYEVGGTSARAATANDVAGLTQGANTAWSRYVAFGDSITSCCSPTVSANLYVNRLGADVGVTPVNDGVSGAMACDVANGQVFPNESPADDKNSLYTLLVSTNEANVKGTGAYEGVFNACHKAVVSWLGSSSFAKFSGPSFVAVPANWALDTTYGAVTGLKSTTNGATSTWSVTTYGGPVAIWYRIVDGNGGTFTYAVDGGTPVAANAFTSPAIATQNGTTQAVAVAFVPVAAGSHGVTITVTSTTGASNLVGILAVGTSPAATHYQGPKVYVGGTPYQRGDNLSAATAEYNADVIANVNLLAGYGFGAQFVNVRNYLFGTAAEMASGTTGLLHPGDLGHQHLEQAFEAAIQPINVPGPWNVQAETVATGNYTVQTSDRVVYTNCAAACTITLPTSTFGQIVFVSYYGGASPSIATPGSLTGPSALLATGNGVLYHNAQGSWNAIASTFPTSSIQNVPISGSTGSFSSLAVGDSVVTGNIGGSALAAGTCTAPTTVAIPTVGATMTVVVSPTNGTDPGSGFFEKAWVSSYGNVTVEVCATVGGTPPALPYRVSVIR